MNYNIPLPRVLDDSGAELRRLNVLDASVSLTLTPLSTAAVSLPGSETLDTRDWVELYTSQGSAGIFRVRSPAHNYRLDTKEYDLDHGIAEIGDYIIKGEIEIESAAADTVIRQLFSHYGGQRWQLGTVAPTQTVSYNGDHENVLSALLNVMDQLPDYMLSCDQTTATWTLHVIQRPSTVSGEGRLGRNIASCRITEDDQNLCTRIYSESLTGGHMDADTIDTYGVVEQHFSKDEYTPQAQFEADCARYLEQHKRPLLSVAIDLQDLQQITGEALDGVAIGDLYRLEMPDYGVTQQQTVVSLLWRSVYGNPGAVNVTLANEEVTMSGAMHSAASKAASSIAKASRAARGNSESVKEINGVLYSAGLQIDPVTGVWLYASEQGEDYALGASLKVQADAIASEVARATSAEGVIGSSILQTASAIYQEVHAANSTIYSTIEQTAYGIRGEFADIEEGLYNEILATASGIRQTMIANTNRTIVNDTDPRSATYTPKDGDIWIESTYQGSWDGASGFDWEHDEDYDWTQVQGAKVWTWKNDQWQLVADRQQLVTYSDFLNTADLLISQKIVELANEQGQVEVYRSLIEQTGERIRSEVYEITSAIYSYIYQTASGIVIGVGGGAHVIVQDAVQDGVPLVITQDGPTDGNGRKLKNGDIWVDTANQESWDKAMNWNWLDDEDYDWNDLRDDVIYVYDEMNQTWVPRSNGRILADHVDIEIDDDHMAILARNIEVVHGEVRENNARFQVEADRIYATFDDRFRQMGSRVEQTTEQLRSEYHASNSRIYSELTQTASSLTSRFENRLEDVGSNITQTANTLRSEYYASNSRIYSEFVQTATNLYSRIGNEIAGVNSTIEQTASSIRLAVENSISGIRSEIKQTADAITLSVSQSESSIWSSIHQTATQVAIKVGKGDVATQLAVEMGNVTVSNGNLRVDGYITSQGLISALGSFSSGISTSGTISGTNIYAGSLYLGQEEQRVVQKVLKMGNVTFTGGQIAGLGTAGDLDADHYHDISASISNGVVTITQGKARSTAGTASFNMADTSWYAGRVSAFKSAVSTALGSAGWNTSVGNSTVIYAVLDKANLRLNVNQAYATISYPGDNTATQVPISLGYLDLSSYFTTVNYARGGLNSVGYRALYYYNDSTDRYVSASGDNAAHYWYWASNSATLTTLYS